MQDASEDSKSWKIRRSEQQTQSSSSSHRCAAEINVDRKLGRCHKIWITTFRKQWLSPSFFKPFFNIFNSLVVFHKNRKARGPHVRSKSFVNQSFTMTETQSNNFSPTDVN